MTLDKNYISFLNTIKTTILSARIRTYRGLNRELIKLYWDLGKVIVERQKQYGWGQSIVERLSRDLKYEFPNTGGFSDRNLWDMRRFYEAYKNNTNLRPAVAEIPWGHNLLILNKTNDMQ